MKRLLTLISATVILASCSKSNLKTDWEKNDLKGQVKSIKEYSYFAIVENGNITKGDRGRSGASESDVDKILTFNADGNLIDEKDYTSTDSLISHIKYEYQKNKKTGETWFNAQNKPYLTVKYDYGFGGSLKDMERFDSDGNLTEKHTYKFDRKGNKVSETWLDADGNEDSSWDFTYDKNGNLVEETWINSEGAPNYNRTLFYDNNGNISSQNWYLAFGPSSEWIYNYDNSNRLVETIAKLSDGSQLIQKYELDKNGNWIKAVQYNNNLPTYVIEREIEYFQ